jgi:uracil-DNA glycosylase
MKHLTPIGHFPSGQPILPVRQADLTPKRVFVLGVYASAVHARWTHPNGRTRIAALAVASEPEIFWTGQGADQIIASIATPDGTGRLFPAGDNLNGPSGRALDERILTPLDLCRANTWLCDLVPHSCMNPSQEASLHREGLLLPDWPRVPTPLADAQRRAEILDELETSQARILITLGDQPLRWFAAHFGANPRLADYGETPATYGQLHPLTIKDRDLLLLPLAHPRQIARLGAHSDKWAALHAAWISKHSILSLPIA